MNIKQVFYIKAILFLGIAVYLSFTFDTALSNLVSKSGISFVSGSIVLRIIISLAFGRGFQLLLKPIKPKFNSILSFGIGVLLGFTISFVARPIYSIDYTKNELNGVKLDLTALKLKTNNTLNLNNQPALIAFFHTDCNGCKLMSSDLGKYQALGHTPQVFAFFGGTEADAQTFMNEQNGNLYTYFMIDDDDYFIQTADYTFPAVFLVDKDENTVNLWHSSGLGYYDLDLIKSYK